MALYLGDKKLKANFNDTIVKLNLYSEIPIANSIRLVSSDDFILKDSNGLYLTTEGVEY